MSADFFLCTSDESHSSFRVRSVYQWTPLIYALSSFPGLCPSAGVPLHAFWTDTETDWDRPPSPSTSVCPVCSSQCLRPGLRSVLIRECLMSQDQMEFLFLGCKPWLSLVCFCFSFRQEPECVNQWWRGRGQGLVKTSRRFPGYKHYYTCSIHVETFMSQ